MFFNAIIVQTRSSLVHKDWKSNNVQMQEFKKLWNQPVTKETVKGKTNEKLTSLTTGNK